MTKTRQKKIIKKIINALRKKRKTYDIKISSKVVGSVLLYANQKRTTGKSIYLPFESIDGSLSIYLTPSPPPNTKTKCAKLPLYENPVTPPKFHQLSPQKSRPPANKKYEYRRCSQKGYSHSNGFHSLRHASNFRSDMRKQVVYHSM